MTEDGGADAVIWSETAEYIWFSVIEDEDEPSVFADIALEYGDIDSSIFFDAARRNPVVSRTIHGVHETLFAMTGPNYGKWFVHIPHAWNGMRYGYRADGKWDPSKGLQFNPRKFLIDPCAKGLSGSVHYGPALFAYQAQTEENGSVNGNLFSGPSTIDSLGSVPYSVVIDDRDLHKHDADVHHPHIPWARTIIYELHVKGFTRQAPWLPASLRGTYAGLAHPQTIAYLKGLGVTSIELLPIFAKQTEPPLMSRGKTNYWGYSTLNFFTPEASYATAQHQAQGPQAVRQEVIHMVEALHAAGLEVILDVVYNHSCEGGTDGYTLSWRGIDGYNYYRRNPHSPYQLIDTTGTGNTFNFLNTNVIIAATDSLRYWAKRIGVDGFRFDLAASLARLEYDFTPYHPFLYAIRSDPMLGNLKLIMEPWDTGNGGWQTGKFGMPFSEWNDRFRDSVRKFWLTDEQRSATNNTAEIGMQEMATRLCGSSDLFATEPGRGAAASVNFVTAHDGMTLTDLTRYTAKRNQANGENNSDGSNANYSVNFGVEGPSTNSQINQQRQRAALGLIGTLLMSMGTPMLQSGDEFGKTQNGNNNAYCQDNPTSWIDWSWMRTDIHSWQKQRFGATRKLIHLRQNLIQFHHSAFYTLTTQLGLLQPTSQILWYLPGDHKPNDSDWFNTQQRSFMMRITSADHDDILIALNGQTDPISFVLPKDCAWKLLWTSQNIQLTHPTEAELTVPLDELAKSGLDGLNGISGLRSVDDHHDTADLTANPLEEAAQVQDASNQMNNLLAQTHPDGYHPDNVGPDISTDVGGSEGEALNVTSDDEDPESTFMISTTIRPDTRDGAKDGVNDNVDFNIANPGENVTIPEFTISLWRYQKLED